MTATAALADPTADIAAPDPSRVVIRAFVYVLDPTPGQVEALRSNCGAQRFAYNWALSQVKSNLDQRTAERSYGVPDAGLTPSMSWSAYSLRKHWNTVKDDVAVNPETGQVWWSANSKEAYSSGIANCANALSNWSAARSGKRAGTMRFPRFKSKRAASSCRFTTGCIGLVTTDGDRRHVQLPRIGVVRTAESTRKLARKTIAGTARIRSATVSFRRGSLAGVVLRRDASPCTSPPAHHDRSAIGGRGSMWGGQAPRGSLDR